MGRLCLGYSPPQPVLRAHPGVCWWLRRALFTKGKSDRPLVCSLCCFTGVGKLWHKRREREEN